MSEPEPLEIYANQARFSASPFDITIEFGLNTPNFEGGPQETQIICRLRISPQEGAFLAKALTEVMAGWEQTYGSLVLPDEVLRLEDVPLDKPTHEAQRDNPDDDDRALTEHAQHA